MGFWQGQGEIDLLIGSKKFNKIFSQIRMKIERVSGIFCYIFTGKRLDMVDFLPTRSIFS